MGYIPYLLPLPPLLKITKGLEGVGVKKKNLIDFLKLDHIKNTLEGVKKFKKFKNKSGGVF